MKRPPITNTAPRPLCEASEPLGDIDTLLAQFREYVYESKLADHQRMQLIDNRDLITSLQKTLRKTEDECDGLRAQNHNLLRENHNLLRENRTLLKEKESFVQKGSSHEND